MFSITGHYVKSGKGILSWGPSDLQLVNGFDI